MAVGEGKERFIIGDTIPNVYLPEKDIPNAMATATAILTTEHAPEHAIPLKKKHHPQAYFQEEREGWHGYVEWERYPEKKATAANILSQYAFADVGFSYLLHLLGPK